MFCLENLFQKMLQWNNWKSFFQNIENKQAYIDLFSKYLICECFPEVFKIPIIFPNDKYVSISWRKRKVLFTYNNEEADTGAVLHACLKDTNRVVVSDDTNVFVLMVFAFAFKNMKPSWSMKIDHNKCINTVKVVNYFGNNLALKLLHIHGITGCNTTSFMFSTRKVKVLKKCTKRVLKISLLSGFGESLTVHYKVTQNVSKFIQTICYTGLEIANLMESRVRLYRGMKTKALLTLPPDPKSMEPAILIIQQQIYY